MSILVIDDVDYLRECFSAALEQVGYEVIEAGSGVEAMLKFEANQSEIDLMLVDVELQDTNGKNIINLLRKMKPSIKAILISSHDVGDLRQLFSDTPIEAILPKPVSIKQLRQTVALHY